MDLADLAIFLSVVGLLGLGMAVGAMVAVGWLPLWWLGVGAGALLIFALLALLGWLAVNFLLPRLRRAPKKDAEPAEEKLMPLAVDTIMQEELAVRCENTEEKFLCCMMSLENLARTEAELGREKLMELLLEVKKRLKGILKPEDRVYLTNHDEFILVMNEEPIEEWKARVDRIDREMRSMFVLKDGKTTVDTSVATGYAIFPTMSNSPSGLIDIALEQMELDRDEIRTPEPQLPDPEARLPEEAAADEAAPGKLPEDGTAA